MKLKIKKSLIVFAGLIIISSNGLFCQNLKQNDTCFTANECKIIALKLENLDNCQKNEVLLISINSNLESQIENKKLEIIKKNQLIDELISDKETVKSKITIACLLGFALGILICL